MCYLSLNTDLKRNCKNCKKKSSFILVGKSYWLIFLVWNVNRVNTGDTIKHLILVCAIRQ